jgi:hypothetical protein
MTAQAEPGRCRLAPSDHDPTELQLMALDLRAPNRNNEGKFMWQIQYPYAIICSYTLHVVYFYLHLGDLRGKCW